MIQKSANATALLVVTSFCLFCGCTTQNFKAPELVRNAYITESGEPSHITVQHILIGFQGSLRGKTIQRSPEEAEKLAGEILKKAQSSKDFEKLVIEYTDDAVPGIYHMANHGEPSDASNKDPDAMVMPRSGMVSAFGDVGFPLEVGQVGIANYHPRTSPFGWHIIKRLK